MKLQEYNEFKKMVGYGMEYLLYFNDEEYWISCNSEGYYLTRSKDSYSQDFLNSEELFENGRIDGKSILEIWEEIKDQF